MLSENNRAKEGFTWENIGHSIEEEILVGPLTERIMESVKVLRLLAPINQHLQRHRRHHGVRIEIRPGQTHQSCPIRPGPKNAGIIHRRRGVEHFHPDLGDNPVRVHHLFSAQNHLIPLMGEHVGQEGGVNQLGEIRRADRRCG